MPVSKRFLRLFESRRIRRPAFALSLLLLAINSFSQQHSAGAGNEKSSAASQQNGPANSRPENSAPYAMRVTVPLVTLDVSVLTENGFHVPELKQENFHVMEDGVEQTISGFSERHAPITAVLLVELASDFSRLHLNALNAGYSFFSTLSNDDWAAVVLFDKRTHIIQDFTQDQEAVKESLYHIDLPPSREIRLFDSLLETLDRLQEVKGRKYIILMASGLDTLSTHVYGDVLKRLESTSDTVIYAIDSTSIVRRAQEENELWAYARMTGGRAYFPKSSEEYADAFHQIGQSIRNHYTISYRPTHQPDGKWHKIKVTVVNPAGSAAGSKEDIGRKYRVIAREGYRSDPK